MKLKIKLDIVGLATAVRTAGALMVGNAGIGALITPVPNFKALALLFVLGCATIVVGGLTFKKE